ncbi:TPA_asm: polyprotein, partial [Strongylocentrotus purpuratus associated pircornavirus 2]
GISSEVSLKTHLTKNGQYGPHRGLRASAQTTPRRGVLVGGVPSLHAIPHQARPCLAGSADCEPTHVRGTSNQPEPLRASGLSLPQLRAAGTSRPISVYTPLATSLSRPTKGLYAWSSKQALQNILATEGNSSVLDTLDAPLSREQSLNVLERFVSSVNSSGEAQMETDKSPFVGFSIDLPNLSEAVDSVTEYFRTSAYDTLEAAMPDPLGGIKRKTREVTQLREQASVELPPEEIQPEPEAGPSRFSKVTGGYFDSAINIFGHLTGKMGRAISGCLDVIQGVYNWLEEKFTWIRRHPKLSTFIFLILMSHVSFVRDMTWAVLKKTLALVGTMTLNLPRFLTEILGSIQRLFQHMPTNGTIGGSSTFSGTAQMGAEGPSALIAMALMALLPNPNSGDYTKTLAHAFSISRGVSVFGTGFSYCATLLPARVKCYLRDMGVITDSIELDPDFDALVTRCNKRNARIVNESKTIWKENGFASGFLTDLHNLRFSWPEAMTSIPSNHPQRKVVMTVLNQMIQNQVKATEIVSVGNKPIPVGMYFYGSTGIGKSFLTNALGLVVSGGGEAGASTYNRNLEKYWSGFFGQDTVTYDDWGVGDQTLVAEACNELLTHISPILSRVPMADVADKGLVNNARAYFLTSNTPLETAHWIQNQDAFNRRFEYFVVVLKKEFATEEGLLDMAKFSALSAAERCMFPHLSFQRMRRTTKPNKVKTYEMSGNPMTFMELAVFIKGALRCAEIASTEHGHTVEEFVKVMREQEIIAAAPKVFEPIAPAREPHPFAAEFAGQAQMKRSRNRGKRGGPRAKRMAFMDFFPFIDRSSLSDHEWAWLNEPKSDKERNHRARMVVRNSEAMASYCVKVDRVGYSKCTTAKEQWEFAQWLLQKKGSESLYGKCKAGIPFRAHAHIPVDVAAAVHARLAELASEKKDDEDGTPPPKPPLRTVKKMEKPRAPAPKKWGPPTSATDPPATDATSTAPKVLSSVAPTPGEEQKEKDIKVPTFVEVLASDCNSDSSFPGEIVYPYDAESETDCFEECTKYDDFKHPTAGLSTTDVKYLGTDARCPVLKNVPEDYVKPEAKPVVAGTGPVAFVTGQAQAAIDAVNEKVTGISRQTWGKAFGVFAGAAALVTLGSYFLNRGEDELTEEFSGKHQSRDVDTVRKARTKRTKRPRRSQRHYLNANNGAGRTLYIGKNVRAWRGTPQGVEWDNEVNTILDKVAANCVALTMTIEHEGVKITRRMNGWISRDRELVANAHFFRDRTKGAHSMVPEGTTFFVTLGGAAYKIPFSSEHLSLAEREGEALDRVFYALPVTVPQQPSITKYIATAAEHARSEAFEEFTVVGYSEDPQDAYEPLDQVQHDDRKFTWTSGPHVSYSSNDYYVYDRMSNGDCGKLLVGIGNSGVRIFGMHCAERTNNLTLERHGVSDVLLKESFQGYTGNAQQSVEIIEEEKLEIVGLSERYEVLGVVSPRPTKCGTKTKLRESLIAHNYAHIDTEPALLGDAADPRCEGITALDLTVMELNQIPVTAKTFPADMIGDAAEAYGELVSQLPQQYAGVLTVDEAINGSERCPGLGPLNMGKSLGYPLNVGIPADKPGKHSCIEGEPGERKLNAKGREDLESCIAALELERQTGIRVPIFFFATNLKDEKRSAEKIRQMRTRIVNQGPLSHTILMKMFFGALTSRIKCNYDKFFSAIGMNVYSKDWSDMIEKLEAHGLEGFDGDFKKFEGLFNADTTDAMWNKFLEPYFRREWDGKDPEQFEKDLWMRKALLEHTVNCILVVGKFAVRNPGVVPSGTFGTGLLFNTFNCFVLLCCAFIDSAKHIDPDLARIAVFLKEVLGKGYGDDNLVVPTPRVAHVCNFKAFKEAFARNNVKYTPAKKTDGDYLLKPIRELEFLKQQTETNENIIFGMDKFAAPSVENLESSLKWVSNSQPAETSILQNVNDNLRRSFGKGHETFTMLREKWWGELRAEGVMKAPITWSDCVHLWTRDTLDPGVPDPNALFEFESGKDEPRLARSGGFIERKYRTRFTGSAQELNEVVLPQCPVPDCLNLYNPNLTEGCWHHPRGHILPCPVEGCMGTWAPFENPDWDGCADHPLGVDVEDWDDEEEFEIDDDGWDVFHAEHECHHEGCENPVFPGDVLFPFCDFHGMSMYSGEAQMEESGGVGIVFSGEDEKKTDGSRPIAEEMAHDESSEMALSYASVVARPQLYDVLTWTSVSGVLGAFEAPFGLIKSNTAIAAFRSFVYNSSGLSLTVQIQGQPFLQGLLIVYFVPLTTVSDAIASHSNNKSAQLMCPHMFVSASSSKSCTLDIPFVHFKKKLDLNLPQVNLGALVIQAFNPLLAGPTAVGENATARVSIYVSFPDMDFQVLDPTIQPLLFSGEAQMEALSEDPAIVDVNAPTASVVVSPVERAQPRPDRDLRYKHVSDFLKRPGVVYSGITTAQVGIKLADLYVTGSGDYQGGALTFWSRLYRVMKGKHRFLIQSSNRVRVAYTPEPNENTAVTLAESFERTGGPVTMGPTAYGTLDVDFLQFETPFQSLFHLVKIPKNQGERNSIESSVGAVALDFTFADPDALILAGGGDDLRFGYLYYLPTITLAPQAPVEEKFSGTAQGNFTSHVTNVKNSAGHTIDYESTGSSSESKGDANLDYPNIGVTPLGVVRYPMPDVTNMEGVCQARVLDGYPGRQTFISPAQLGTTAREMELSYLYGRKTFLAGFRWDTSQAPGDVLYIGELVPNPVISTSSTSGVANLPITLMDYVTLPFKFWRGSLILTVQLVASKFHTGRLAVCTHYGRRSAEVISLSDALSQYGAILDLTEDSVTHEIVFEYRSPSEMLMVGKPGLNNESDLDRALSTMGEFSVRIVNPLRANETVSQEVAINMFWSAGPDFDVDFAKNVSDKVTIDNPF